jgi:sensor histidine kinase YesM
MSYLYTSVFCCAVGYVAWFALAAATLGQAMIVSFSIGLSINTASVLLRKVIQSYVGFFPSAVLITLLGLVVGLVIGGTLALNDPMGLFTQNSQALLVSGVFGCIGYAVVSTREVLLRTQVKLAEVQLATEVQEKLLARAELRRLQAQIEPHFLFNTLTSVAALIRHDAQAAEHMLENFTVLLRSILDRTRSAETTLAAELEVVDAYLAIQSVRMPERLSYSIEHDPALDAVILPPLILQPLVENAVKYGIETNQDGGQIRVTTATKSDKLEIRLIDSGQGMDVTAEQGIGISNVQERLRSAVDGALLTFSQRPEGGFEALITLPYPSERAQLQGET